MRSAYTSLELITAPAFSLLSEKLSAVRYRSKGWPVTSPSSPLRNSEGMGLASASMAALYCCHLVFRLSCAERLAVSSHFLWGLLRDAWDFELRGMASAKMWSTWRGLRNSVLSASTTSSRPLISTHSQGLIWF